MQANVRGKLGPEVQVIGCPRKRHAAAGCERVHVWPLADEEAQHARLAEEVLPKISALRPPPAKPVPNRGLRAN
jgi:hypothetical protein